MRAAYGASSASTGKGQTVALVELGLTRDMFLTLADYAQANHLPAPSPEQYAQLSLGGDTCGDPFDLEAAARRRGLSRHGTGGEPARRRR